MGVNKLRWPSVGLGLILAAYLLVGASYAIYTPPWQVPDEPAHYNYVRALATTAQLPVIEMGDYDQAYLSQLVFESKFSPELSIEPLEYEDWQPPAYYGLAALVYGSTGGSLLALRFFSLLLGAALLILAFLIVRGMFPAHPSLALGTAAFVAFVPQHLAMMAGVNNDSLAELLLAMVIYLIVNYQLSSVDCQLGDPQAPNVRLESQGFGFVSRRRWVLLGVLLGLGMITKLSFYIALPLVAWAMLRSYTVQVSGQAQGKLTSPSRFTSRIIPSLSRDVSRLAFHVSRFTFHALPLLLPALLIALPWWLRNVGVYGWPDVMGLVRHNAVVVGQPTTTWWIEQYGWASLAQRLFTFTFQSFWGQFGWMTVPLSPRYYLALGALSVAALAGCLWAAWPRRRELLADARFQLLGAWVGLTLLMYLYYNLGFVQHQGRYLFPALIPLGLAFSVGWQQWTRILPRGWAWREAFMILPYLGLLALDLLALFRAIVPSLS
ncbi:MAG: glycosyltransferase family 39 protein [Thermoflexales bacterium]|nr:glycosyltransferase family 39 protein [Thermoflexales bacterium]